MLLMNFDDLKEQKKILRREMLARRRAMPSEVVVKKSQQIMDRVAAMPEVQQAGTILSYVASKDNEVDTKPFIAAMLAEGRIVLIPIAQPDGEMLWAAIDSLDEVQPRRFGILEPDPDTARICKVPEDSVCLVPGLAFTTSGHRLGYGGGYFDRFLSAYGGFPVGISYSAQLLETLPVGEHDRKLPLVVTEKSILCCAKME